MTASNHGELGEMSYELLTVREAARFLRLSKATPDRWRLDGQGPCHVRLEARVFYPREELERFVRARRVRTAAYPPRSGDDDRA